MTGAGRSSAPRWIRAYRLALGIALADVVAQVRARYATEGRTPPRFSETLLSAYESGQKRPGPEYLHYLCAVYQVRASGPRLPGPVLLRPDRHRGDLVAGPDAIAGQGAAWPPCDRSPAPRDGTRPQAGGRAAGGRRYPAGARRGDPDRRGARRSLVAEGPEPGGEADDDMVRRALLRLIADAATRGRTAGSSAPSERIRRRMDDALLGGDRVGHHAGPVGGDGRAATAGST